MRAARGCSPPLLAPPSLALPVRALLLLPSLLVCTVLAHHPRPTRHACPRLPPLPLPLLLPLLIPLLLLLLLLVLVLVLVGHVCGVVVECGGGGGLEEEGSRGAQVATGLLQAALAQKVVAVADRVARAGHTEKKRAEGRRRQQQKGGEGGGRGDSASNERLLMARAQADRSHPKGALSTKCTIMARRIVLYVMHSQAFT